MINLIMSCTWLVLTYFNGFVKERLFNLSVLTIVKTALKQIVKTALKQNKKEHFQCIYNRWFHRLLK